VTAGGRPPPPGSVPRAGDRERSRSRAGRFPLPRSRRFFGRQHEERIREGWVSPPAVTAPLLHGLEEGGLGLRVPRFTSSTRRRFARRAPAGTASPPSARGLEEDGGADHVRRRSRGALDREEGEAEDPGGVRTRRVLPSPGTPSRRTSPPRGWRPDRVHHLRGAEEGPRRLRPNPAAGPLEPRGSASRRAASPAAAAPSGPGGGGSRVDLVEGPARRGWSRAGGRRPAIQATARRTAHANPAWGTEAVAPEVHVTSGRTPPEPVLREAPLQQRGGRGCARSPDDLAVVGCEEVGAEGDLRARRVRLHVEGLHFRRVPGHEDRAGRTAGEEDLVGAPRSSPQGAAVRSSPSRRRPAALTMETASS